MSMTNLRKYFFLLIELVSRDLKLRYRRSFLGFLWSLLNPLFMMLLITMVFSTLFKSQIANFPIYFMCGQILFNFFSEATNIAMESILVNASLIKKVYIPKFIFPLSKVISSFVNLLFSLISLVIVMLFTKAPFSIFLILVPLPLLYIFIFATGVSLFVTALIVFFRDVKYLYGVLITAWAYFTPIFYPASIIPEKFKFMLDYNPMYHIITCFRDIVYHANPSTVAQHGLSLAISLLALLIGAFVFKKAQNKFILYI